MISHGTADIAKGKLLVIKFQLWNCSNGCFRINPINIFTGGIIFVSLMTTTHTLTREFNNGT